jgi:hypothetical protein
MRTDPLAVAADRTRFRPPLFKKRLTFLSYPRPHIALDMLQVLFCAKIADLPASGRKA